MQKCLVDICKKFESTSNFLRDKTDEKTTTVNSLFLKFIECFASLREEKLDFPKEFANDVSLYIDNNKALVEKFEDVEMRYLIISDFYDYCRITKKF